MTKWMSVLAFAGVVTMGLPACATKGFVKNRVGEVNTKVNDLAGSVEATQERTLEAVRCNPPCPHGQSPPQKQGHPSVQ